MNFQYGHDVIMVTFVFVKRISYESLQKCQAYQKNNVCYCCRKFMDFLHQYIFLLCKYYQYKL